MQQIETTSADISVTDRVDPLTSVFGREMRPGVTDVKALPWNEIARVTLTMTTLPPDETRWVELHIDAIWGEFVTVHESAQGFAQTVQDLCRLSALPVPDYASSTPGAMTIWRAA